MPPLSQWFTPFPAQVRLCWTDEAVVADWEIALRTTTSILVCLFPLFAHDVIEIEMLDGSSRTYAVHDRSTVGDVLAKVCADNTIHNPTEWGLVEIRSDRKLEANDEVDRAAAGSSDGVDAGSSSSSSSEKSGGAGARFQGGAPCPSERLLPLTELIVDELLMSWEEAARAKWGKACAAVAGAEYRVVLRKATSLHLARPSRREAELEFRQAVDDVRRGAFEVSASTETVVEKPPGGGGGALGVGGHSNKQHAHAGGTLQELYDLCALAMYDRLERDAADKDGAGGGLLMEKPKAPVPDGGRRGVMTRRGGGGKATEANGMGTKRGADGMGTKRGGKAGGIGTKRGGKAAVASADGGGGGERPAKAPPAPRRLSNMTPRARAGRAHARSEAERDGKEAGAGAEDGEGGEGGEDDGTLTATIRRYVPQSWVDELAAIEREQGWGAALQREADWEVAIRRSFDELRHIGETELDAAGSGSNLTTTRKEVLLPLPSGAHPSPCGCLYPSLAQCAMAGARAPYGERALRRGGAAAVRAPRPARPDVLLGALRGAAVGGGALGAHPAGGALRRRVALHP